MIFNIKPIVPSLVVIAAICASMVGCASRDINPLTAGFEEVTYTHTSLSEPPASRVSLQHKNKAGKRVMIWPSLFGVRSVIKDDIAIFVGDQGYKAPPNNVRSTRPRLFAVKAPGPPLDITDEVLWRWSKQSGEDFTNVMRRASITYPKEKDNVIELFFAAGIHNDIVVRTDWNQILDVMREVKEKGVVRKDSVWGTTYIQKEFMPEEKR